MQNAEFLVRFNFTNKNGEKKTVKVFVDKETYAILPKLSEEDRINYLIDLYHEQEREKYYSRGIIPFSRFSNNEDGDYDLEDTVDVEKKTIQRILIRQMIDYLSPIDREFILLRFFDGLTIESIAKRMNVNEKTVRRNLARILNDLKEHFNY